MKPLTSYTCKLTDAQAAALRDWLRAHQYQFREVPYARFAAEREKTNLVFYESGKLVVQGKGTQEFVEFVLEPEIVREARLGYEAVLNPDLLLPRLGVDESGKGDFFGPLCIAGAYVNQAVVNSWEDAGIRDSKNISSDKRIQDLAELIRKTPGCVTTVVPIGNEAYNRLYAKMKSVNGVKPIKIEAPKSDPGLFPEFENGYNLPPLTLLDAGTPVEKIDKAELLEKKRLIEEKLREFRIEGEVKEYSPGPVITTYEFYPSPGIKIAQVTNLSEDLSLALRAESVRVQRIPGKSSLGVEIPNNTREIIRLRDILASEEFRGSPSKLTFALGKTVHGEVYITDLTQMPHLLIAGATGTGKSVALNALIASILYKASPEEVRIVLIDPKQIEFSLYDGVPHLLSPVIKDPKKAGFVLMDAVKRMEERLYILGQHKVRNIHQYNQQVAQALKEKKGRLTDEERVRLKPLPYIVIIIDELAELMMVSGQDVDYAIGRLAQLARAVGIHLVLATQRPSIDVITGTIKNNFSSRIAFRVPSKIDSRIILDAGGAEKLLGKGDMLFIPPANPHLLRLHGAYVSNAEIRRLVRFVAEQGQPVYDERIAEILDSTSGPSFLEAGEKDERYDEAVRLVLNTGQASASYLQRRLKLGYARASRIIDQMEQEGLLGPADGSKPREILVDPKEYPVGIKKGKPDKENGN